MVKRSKWGFTMVEMLMVLIFLGILAGIGLLKYIDLRNTARTASLVADFRAVTVAVLNYYGDKDTWPAETGPGVVPDDLKPYLSGGLVDSFDRNYYVLDYENFPVDPPGALIAVAVSSSDARLMAKFIQAFSTKSPFFMNNGQLTYLIAGPGGVF